MGTDAGAGNRRMPLLWTPWEAGRAVKLWEVVTTDNSAWHSKGITGITVYSTREEAEGNLAYLRTHGYDGTTGKGAFIRESFDRREPLTEEGQAVNPKVWADGFGVWHASVPITDSPRRDAMAARKLIKAELEARYAPNYDPRTLHVVKERVTSHGTVIYRER